MLSSLSAGDCNSAITGIADNFPASNGLVMVGAMSGGTQFRSPKRCDTRLLVLVLIALPLVTAKYSAAQIHGVPPSVTSIQFHTLPFMPNIRPSVISLGPYGYGSTYPVSGQYRGRNGNGYRYRDGYRYRNGDGYSTGAYIAPYYFPAYDTSYGYDSSGGGGPYVYSGPPAEQTLHIVVDLPPAKRTVAEDDGDDPPPTIASKPNRNDSAADANAKPVDPTVLVFRDGHQQEVTNYAIMGQTVYVFDNRTQKIALTDLDVAATIKVNDDRGVDFHVPPHTKS